MNTEKIKKSLPGQRTTFALVSLIVLFAGALLGTPGDSVTLPDGSIFDADTLTTLLVDILTPAGALVASLTAVFGSINRRVAEGEIEAGDLVALLYLPETYMYSTVLLASVSSLFGVEVLNSEADQKELATGLQLVLTFLLRTTGARPSGAGAGQTATGSNAVTLLDGPPASVG